MGRKLLLASIFCFFALTSFAQFNDTTHYYVGYVSTGSINKTNDGSSYLLNNALKFSEKKKSVVMNFNNNWVYGKSNSSITNNDFTSSFDFDLYQSPNFYYWGLANYATSVSLKINNQLLTGFGAAYYFVNTKNAMFNVSDGFLYDKSDLYLDDGTRDVYHTYRNSFRILFKFVIKDLIVLDGSDFIQNSVQRKSDYIIHSTTNLSVKLRKWLSFTTSFNYNRMNRTQRENMLLNYGLTAEKYF